jgi:hypothetical protein
MPILAAVAGGNATLLLVAIIVALILAAIALFQSEGRGLLAWAVVVLCLGLLIVQVF